MLMLARQTKTLSGWLLLMEDDVGASLATPKSWKYSLQELVEYCPKETLAIQLAPISAVIRMELYKEWTDSNGKCLAISKDRVRSHGNGAVLIHKKAVEQLIDPLLRISQKYLRNVHPLLHPWRIRPVADKWIYGALPKGTCKVATYQQFCLDAKDSSLHQEHVNNFHKPSRNTTLDIWKRDNMKELLEAQRIWDIIQ